MRRSKCKFDSYAYNHVHVDVDVFNVHINLPIISLKNFPGCWIVARQQEKSGSPVLQGLQK